MIELRTRRHRIRRLLAVAAAVLGAAALLTPPAFAAPASRTAPYSATRTSGANAPVFEATAVALAPDHSGVYQWQANPTNPTGWQKIGGPAGHLYAGYGEILATEPGSGDLYLYLTQSGSWTRIGGPGRTFVIAPLSTTNVIFGLSPDGSGVWAYDVALNKWYQIGGPATWIYGSSFGLFATQPGTGNILKWNAPNPFDWSLIGGPGKTFVANSDGLYGLTPSGDAVNEWVGQTTWANVGTAATWLYGASHTLLATEPGNGDVWMYRKTGTPWTRIGSAGSDFHVSSSNNNIYGLSLNKDAVDVWVGDPSVTTWHQIGGPASELGAI